MWVRIDDGMHRHRKTRAVTKSHPTKSRDAAPLGLWVCAASWAGDAGTDGWVPEDELDRWDSEWKPLVARLVSSGYWWPHSRDGEPGFGFSDWHDYNDPADAASKAGTYGNHVRWHVNEKRVDPDCEHCPKEPEPLESVAPRSGGESHIPSGAIALPEPEPDPNPTRTRNTLRASAQETPVRFEEFWTTYDHKVGRAKAVAAYRKALTKAGVTDDLLIAAAFAYITWCKGEDKHPKFTKHAATWLNGEHWTDERVGRPERPASRVSEHMALAERLRNPPIGELA